ncbi:MAG: hypothetical protein L3J09_04490 [Flavobacteriaceae bacterium]|nr:hypothetical protein [Flavobacteriaceae bacterium]
MELAKIESVLDSYFEGETTLAEEKMLREYFSGNQVAPHLEAYKNLFIGLKNAQAEVSEKEVILPKVTNSSNRRRWLSVAVSVVIVLGVVGLQFSENNNQLTPEEEQALAEFNKTKETLLLLSNSFNKGTGELAVLGEFTIAKNKILK